MGAVLGDPDHHKSHLELSDLAAMMKSKAKRASGNCMRIGRRAMKAEGFRDETHATTVDPRFEMGTAQ